MTVEVDKASGAASTSARMNPATDEVWKPAHPAVADVSNVLLSARRSAHPVDLVSSSSTTLANTGLLSSSDVCDQLLNASFVVLIACSQSARVERWTLWTGVLLAGCVTVNVLPAELALATLWIRLETTDIDVFRVDDETVQVIREQVEVLHSVQISVASDVKHLSHGDLQTLLAVEVALRLCARQSMDGSTACACRQPLHSETLSVIQPNACAREPIYGYN